MRTRWAALWPVVFLGLTLAPISNASAQCQEFCSRPLPPCYAVDDPDTEKCNPLCNCEAENYPFCDPGWSPGDPNPDPTCEKEDNPCWGGEFQGDICSDPPPACEEEVEPPWRFEGDDGPGDEEIAVVQTPGRTESCGKLTVDETGYYEIFDRELSESCDDQRDETGYVTISNPCNAEGWAIERNAGDRFLVMDSDNEGRGCENDNECGDGKGCREARSTHGRCCVPNEPIFMGTFLLVEGENTICLKHWCPEWKAIKDEGQDFGFVTQGCKDPANSIHFRVADNVRVCKNERTLTPCAWGCNIEAGECNPDPCDGMSCQNFCFEGMCTDTNPCDGLNCEHGCKRGYCLQPSHARGPDGDGDGFSNVADCNDDDADAFPNAPEICQNNQDDDCDGQIDEPDCGSNRGGGDGGTPTGDGGTSGEDGDGCGCRIPGSQASSRLSLGAALTLSLLGLLWWRRRQRR